MRFSEVILTLGSSQTVIEFLCAAKEKKRSFRVFVAEGAPRFVQVATPFFARHTSLPSSLIMWLIILILLGIPLRYQGHILAKELVTRGLQTTVITDSAVFAMISRVNMVCIYLNALFFLMYTVLTSTCNIFKVIVGAHAVMANGGVIAPVGLNMVALAAQRHAVPFVVLAGIHKVFWISNSFSYNIALSENEQNDCLTACSLLHFVM